jgi:hypothetical protein
MFKRLTQRVMHICMAVVLLFAFVLIAPGAQIARAEGNNYTLAAQGDCTAFLAAIGGNGFERSDFYVTKANVLFKVGHYPSVTH